MRNAVNPYLFVALLVMLGFFAWLMMQMARTELADRRLLLMAGSFAAAGLALGAGALGRRG
jgi:hypothetical protein